MKTAVFIMTLFVAAAALADDSPLVKAAKAGGGPRKKSKTKVITNADVQKSAGKLMVLPPKPGQPAAASAPQKGPLELQNDERHARERADVRVAAAQKKVDDLEKELRRIEETYYAENDPNYRDSTIEPRFNHTKKQLDDARKELTDARDGPPKAAMSKQ